MAEVVQVKVSLKGIRPPIWRRLQLNGSASLAELHDAIQWSMGWHDCHLHLFTVGKDCYGRPSEDDPEPVKPEHKVTLRQLSRRGVKKFGYTYDFGDSWDHEVLFEKPVKLEPGAVFPRCLAGRRACPPEDCGGPFAYASLLAALADPDQAGTDDDTGILPSGFDPDRFDKAAVNRRLAPMSPISAVA